MRVGQGSSATQAALAVFAALAFFTLSTGKTKLGLYRTLCCTL